MRSRYARRAVAIAADGLARGGVVAEDAGLPRLAVLRLPLGGRAVAVAGVLSDRQCGLALHPRPLEVRLAVVAARGAAPEAAASQLQLVYEIRDRYHACTKFSTSAAGSKFSICFGY